MQLKLYKLLLFECAERVGRELDDVIVGVKSGSYSREYMIFAMTIYIPVIDPLLHFISTLLEKFPSFYTYFTIFFSGVLINYILKER